MYTFVIRASSAGRCVARIPAHISCHVRTGGTLQAFGRRHERQRLHIGLHWIRCSPFACSFALSSVLQFMLVYRVLLVPSRSTAALQLFLPWLHNTAVLLLAAVKAFPSQLQWK